MDIKQVQELLVNNQIDWLDIQRSANKIDPDATLISYLHLKFLCKEVHGSGRHSRGRNQSQICLQFQNL